MSIVKRSLELESWLDLHASGWEMKCDRDYKTLCRHWIAAFSHAVASGRSHSCGRKAVEEFEARLPDDVLMLSGLRIDRLGGAGGQVAIAYAVDGLTNLSIELGSRLELVVVASDYSWCLPLSHEIRGLVFEEFFVR